MKKAKEPEVPKQLAKEDNPIAKEIEKYEEQLAEIQKALKDVNLDDINDPKQKLDMTDSKVKIMEKLPKLLAMLRALKEESKIRSADIRGEGELSLNEKGEI